MELDDQSIDSLTAREDRCCELTNAKEITEMFGNRKLENDEEKNYVKEKSETPT